MPAMGLPMSASAFRSDEYKLVVVVRKDLKMGKGKLAAQVAHAAVECALYSEKKDRKSFDKWHDSGQAKVVLKVDTLEELMRVVAEAKSVGLHTSVITDAGRTQIEPGSVTCAGIGPAVAGDIDRVTGDLKMCRSLQDEGAPHAARRVAGAEHVSEPVPVEILVGYPALGSRSQAYILAGLVRAGRIPGQVSAVELIGDGAFAIRLMRRSKHRGKGRQHDRQAAPLDVAPPIESVH